MSKNSFLTPLKVEVMETGKTFKLTYPFTYAWRGKQGIKISVPVGFVTDFASIPWGARLIIPKLGKHTKASVVHDYLYKTKSLPAFAAPLSRIFADTVFRDGMRDLGVVKWKRTAMFWAVRLFGCLAWRN